MQEKKTMPLIPSSYQAPRWLVGKHMQTIVPMLYRKNEEVPCHQERFQTSDHDFIDLEWSMQGSQKLAIFCYGLSATSQVKYALGMRKKLSTIGYDILIWNYRRKIEPSKLDNKLKLFTHAGSSHELNEVIEHALSQKKYSDIVLFGFSIGGNIVLKYLGEKGPNVPPILSKAITISPPCNIKAGVKNLLKWDNFLYHRDSFLIFKREVEEKKALYPDLMRNIKLENINTFEDICKYVITPLCGFSHVEEYYQFCDADQYIPQIQLPTLILSARNDPLFDDPNFPIQKCANHPYVSLEMPMEGGHLGFMITTLNGLYYSEERAVDFLKNG